MNILVTNFQDTGEDVMILGAERITPEILGEALTKRDQSFEEVYEVSDEDLSYYIYDPLYCDEKFENDVLSVK